MDLVFIRDGKEYYLEDLEKSFMFSYLFRFSLVNGIDILCEAKIEIEGKLSSSLEEYLKEALACLLQDAYEDPSMRHRQKHSSHYEIFLFEGRRYVVNYTSSNVGRLMYLLALRLRLLEEKCSVFLIVKS